MLQQQLLTFISIFFISLIVEIVKIKFHFHIWLKYMLALHRLKYDTVIIVVVRSSSSNSDVNVLWISRALKYFYYFAWHFGARLISMMNVFYVILMTLYTNLRLLTTLVVQKRKFASLRGLASSNLHFGEFIPRGTRFTIVNKSEVSSECMFML